MAEIEVTKWNKAITMSKPEIIKFQLMVHCYIQKINHVSAADLSCMTLLGEVGKIKLSDCLTLLVEQGIYGSEQSSRNAITRLQDKNLIIKEGRNKKKVFLNLDLKIQNKGNVLVDIKCFSPNDTNKN